MAKKIKDIIKLLNSFRVKVTLILIFSIFFVMVLSELVIYKFTLDFQFNQLREKLMIIAQTASLSIDADMLMAIPLNQSGISTVTYKTISRQLSRIKEINPSIKYIYTMTKTEQAGIWQFIVDPSPTLEGPKKKGGPTAFPGDKYDAFRFPEMIRGFSGPSADKKIMVDEWGITLSGYAPVRDNNGKVVAVLGVDMLAADVYMAQRMLHLRAIMVFLIGFLLSVWLGILISNSITNRISKLVEGTRRIAADELDFKVEVNGHDEISELAHSFNKMASTLFASKQRLQDYFYRVVQSLVRILEAKDKYTRGHSDRVAEFAGKIALKMGFSKDKAEGLRRAAQLHDIGKLGIPEDILNKKGKLTDEEWKIIKEHPVIGEEAVRSAFPDEDMLSIVRSHHERYNGTGYPDKSKGDDINIFAQIISVADSYDAMTSSRAYRQALGKEKAVEELKRNCGSQFNTQIVKAFLKVLEEE